MPHAAKMKKKVKIDAIPLLVLIAALIALIVILYIKPVETPTMATEKIISKLVGSESQNPVVEEKKLDEIRQMDYVQLKEYFDIKKDFCIYMEDGNGKIIMAKGDNKLTSYSVYCKEK